VEWVPVADEELASSGALAEALAWLRREGKTHHCWRVQSARGEPVLILYVPQLGCAGLWRATGVEWIECTSAADALDHDNARRSSR
jgi:hypothetical protein